ncbi:MAG: hypothetical protein E6R04_11505 [Spirochaetes bacterium]|nr:MAG: hypothetical protein E6R04_11505 [Spirochaetota bacterium]
MCLYGIPYRMRPGQDPKDILSKYRDDWIWLGTPGWWSNLPIARIEEIKAYLKPLYEKKLVPLGPHEWIDFASAEAEELEIHRERIMSAVKAKRK